MPMTIKMMRVGKDETQQAVADAMGIHVQTYRNWEKNPDQLTIDQARKLAAHFDVTVNDIFFAVDHDRKSCQ